MTTPPSPSPQTRLPAPMVTALNTLIRRARRLILLRGLSASCAAGLGAFLVIMIMDASLTLVSAWPRWILSFLAYATWGGATAWYLVRPLAHSFTLTGIARLIETQHPELQERISSAVQLLNSRDLPALRGSDVLIAALTEEAVREAVALKPRQEISFRAALPFVVAAGLALAALGALCLAHPGQVPFLMARATAPFLNLPNVHATDLTIDPGDALIASGSRLQVTLHTTHPAVASATLIQTDERNEETRIAMVAQPATKGQAGHRFRLTIPDVTREFRYRVLAGDALTRYYSVRVAIPPVIKTITAQYRYPEYVQRPTKREPVGTGVIRAPAGTEVTLSAQVSKPAVTAAMIITTPTSTNAITGILNETGDGPVYEFVVTLPADLDGMWTLNVSDEIGLVNRPFGHAIQALADTPPAIVITSPRQRALRLNRNTMLPISYSAEDDFGLADLALVITPSTSSNEFIRPIALPLSPDDPSRKALAGNTGVDTSDPTLAGTAQITVRLRVTDTRPAALGGPHRVESEAITITLDTLADSWAEQTLFSQSQRIKDDVDQIRLRLLAAKTLSTSLTGPLGKEQRLKSGTSKQVDSLQDSLATADTTLQSLAADLETGFFESLAATLNALASNHVNKAETLASQIRLYDTPAERTLINSHVMEEVNASLAALDRALEQQQNTLMALQRAVELDDLANRQAGLAQARQEQEARPDAPHATGADPWQQSENQVADDLAKLIRNSPDSMAQLGGSLSNRAANAARNANDLLRQQTNVTALTREESDALASKLADEMAQLENKLADEAVTLADTLNDTSSQPLNAARAEHAAQAGRQAAAQLQQKEHQPAAEHAEKASAALNDLAQSLKSAAPEEPATDEARGALAQQAETAQKLATQQSRLKDMMEALAEKRPLDALGLLQEQISHEAGDLAREAGTIQAQADALPEPIQSAQQADPSAAHLEDAASHAMQAATLMKAMTPGPASSSPDPTAAATAHQQNQAAQSLQQAAAALTQAASTAAAASPGQTPPSPFSPASQQAMSEGYQSAREASRTRSTAAAMQSSAKLAEAAQAAEADARARGANPKPRSLKPASEAGQALEAPPPASGIPAMMKQIGFKVQDWLRLHDELGDEVLQGAHTEGPEEYRPLIQRYFREISTHKDKE